MQKPNIFLKCGYKVGAGCGSACLPFIVSTCGKWSRNSCYFADVSKIGQDTARCSAFYPLSRFVLVVSLANMALFRVFGAFLEGFMCLVWVCVACVLCVACVAFCARVELGGLEA